ncbi:MAG: hypothetical protein QXM86_02840 [Candidatus Bathyarchaeia archaeon]
MVKFDTNSKMRKTLLVLLAVLLTFAGPTYVVYVLLEVLEVGYAASMLSGLVLLAAGLILIWYLIRKKIIS